MSPNLSSAIEIISAFACWNGSTVAKDLEQHTELFGALDFELKCRHAVAASAAIAFIRIKSAGIPDDLIAEALKACAQAMEVRGDIKGTYPLMTNLIEWYPLSAKKHGPPSCSEHVEWIYADSAGQWFMWSLIERYPTPGDQSELDTIMRIGHDISIPSQTFTESPPKNEDGEQVVRGNGV